jgi:site-specific recombinase XerD
MPNALLPVATARLPALVTGAGQRASRRYVEFFTAQIRNVHTRKAYLAAVTRFTDWCAANGLDDLTALEPVHVATYIEALQGKLAAPSVKQHLAAIKQLLDYLATRGVLTTNPAAAVRGPKHSVKRGKTPVLTVAETRTLLDAIDVGTLHGLRDRAVVATMVYTFARVGAVVSLRMKDCYVQGRRRWLRLHEKGGKRHEMPCHHSLEEYLDAYLDAVAAERQAEAPLFQTIRSGRCTGNPLLQPLVHRMLQVRAAAAGIETKISAHSFRATGITTYLQNGGRLEVAQQMANHESPRTTGLYDRRGDQVSLDEIERILI